MFLHSGFPNLILNPIFLKSQAWRQYDSLSSALQSRPIYTVDGNTAKGALAKRAVRDVRVVNGRLRVILVEGG